MDGQAGRDPNLTIADYPFNQVPPIQIGGSLTSASLVAGAKHTCGIASGGLAYRWGTSTAMAPPFNTPFPADEPLPVRGGQAYTLLVSGEHSTCGPTGGTVWCWGANSNGTAGNGVYGESASPGPLDDPDQ